MTELDRLKGYEHGAVDYVPVPVSPQLLRAKVKVFADLHRKTQQLEVLNARMTMLQDEERRRFARELHDSIGQLLAAISMNKAQFRASLTDEDRSQIEERIERLVHDNPTLSATNARTLDSKTEPPSVSVEVLDEYYFLRDILA